MDSITKLQSKLAEAENILKYVSKELNGYAQDKSVGSNLNFAEIKLRGEQYSFYEHPLKNQMFQDEYFALMIYVISLGGKKEEGWTILYRIAAGCDYQKDLQYLTTDAMTFTEERLSEIIRLIYSADMARTFAIDSLMICFHMGADDAQLQFLANIYDLLKLDKNFLAEAIQFVKIFDSTFWDNPAGKIKAWTILTAKDIATYIGGAPAASMEEAAGLNTNRVIVKNVTYSSSDVLRIDTWKATEIVLVNCRFENCGGIYSSGKSLKIFDCVFDGNTKRYVDSKRYTTFVDYIWSNQKYSEYRGFVHLSDCFIARTTFKNFEDAVPMIYLNKCSMDSCKFLNCKLSGNGSMLIYLDNSEVTQSFFFSDKSYRGTSSRNTSICCLIYLSRSNINNNIFSSCSVSIADVDPNHCGDAYLIILEQESVCIQNRFENIQLSCSCINGFGGRSTSTKTTIGICNSTALDNEGEISMMNISKQKNIFYVGNKNYEV